MSKIFRFAPSPTGMLHVGNVRTAIINWLAARNSGGKFILRIDDTDTTRSKDEFEQAIKEDLLWLGLNWDIEFNQRSRMSKYEEAKNKLIADGRLYPCYESKEELDLKKKLLLSRNLPPIYDRAALKLTEAEKKELEKQGVKPHWRFKLLDQPIKWNDQVRGHVHFDAKNISDPILVRADSTMTYSIASVVDDIEYNITDIIRGEDHISNSAVHIQLFEALGAKSPDFAHLSLIKSLEGEISKRLGGYDIANLRKEGLEAQVIVNFLAKIGSSESPQAEGLMQQLIKEFSFKKFSKAPTKYDPSQLYKLNTKHIHSLQFATALPKLQALGLDKIDENFWNAVHRNLDKIIDIKDWWHICCEEINPIITEPEYLAIAAELLPTEGINQHSWKEWTSKIQLKTNRKGKDLFLPLRLAITGLDKGPEMDLLLPLIGRKELLKRLKNN